MRLVQAAPLQIGAAAAAGARACRQRFSSAPSATARPVQLAGQLEQQARRRRVEARPSRPEARGLRLDQSIRAAARPGRRAPV
jgi:hypothetical protein